jgi:hypothetical protein
MHMKHNDYKAGFFGIMLPATASAVTQLELDLYLFLLTLCFQLGYIYNYLTTSMIKTKKGPTKMLMTRIIVISRDNINKHNIG